jgi:xylulose-5-phosphate/fructose-6-phosphate phosphoketolase
MDAAIKHCTKGLGIWDWASNDQGSEPDVVMVGCGDIPTKEALAATALLRGALRRHQDPLRQRRRPVQDAVRRRASARPVRRRLRQPVHQGPAGHLQLPRLPLADPPPAYRTHQPRNLHVRGYKEKGNINTPLELAIDNEIDRFSSPST